MIDYEAAISGKRPVRTRDGYKVRLISNQGIEPCLLVGYIDGPMGETGPHIWMLDGLYWNDDERDLIQEPEVIEYEAYANCYEDCFGTPFKHLHPIMKRGDPGLIGIVKLKVKIIGGKITVTGEQV